MDFSRRFFLLGSGSIITGSFVSTARGFIRRTGEPFLLPEASARQILYASEVERADGMGFLLTVGEPRWEPDYLPTWHDFFRMEGHDLSSEETVFELCEDWCLSPREFRSPMKEETWECSWLSRYSPSARAFRLLEKVELDSELNGRRALGGLDFVDGQYPGSYDRWVDAEDALSVSLLQARLRELKLPVEVRRGVIE
jgi:hypothetical protein